MSTADRPRELKMGQFKNLKKNNLCVVVRTQFKLKLLMVSEISATCVGMTHLWCGGRQLANWASLPKWWR